MQTPQIGCNTWIFIGFHHDLNALCCLSCWAGSLLSCRLHCFYEHSKEAYLLKLNASLSSWIGDDGQPRAPSDHVVHHLELDFFKFLYWPDSATNHNFLWSNCQCQPMLTKVAWPLSPCLLIRLDRPKPCYGSSLLGAS